MYDKAVLKLTPLSEVKPGSKVVVAGIEGAGIYNQRALCDMGLYPLGIVKVMSVGRDGVVFEKEGISMTIKKELADSIYTQPYCEYVLCDNAELA